MKVKSESEVAQSCLTLCEPYGGYSGLHQGVIHLEYICKYFSQKTWPVIFVLGYVQLLHLN